MPEPTCRRAMSDMCDGLGEVKRMGGEQKRVKV